MTFLLRHSAVYGLHTMLSRLVAFFLLPLYTRYLTPTDYGVLELIGTTSSIVGVILGFGITHALARFYYDLSDADRPRLVASVYALAASAAAIGTVPCMLASPWLASVVLDGAQYTRHFQIGFATLLVGLVSDIGIAYLRLLYRSTASMIVGIAGMVLTVFVNVLLIVWLDFGVLGVLAGNLVGQLLVGLPLTMVVLSSTGFRPDLLMARNVLVFCAPLLPSALMTLSAAQADRYFLRYFVSIADTGIFGIATKLSNSLQMVITSTFMLTFLPRRFEIADQPNAKSVLARIYDMHVLAVLLPATVIAIFVREILMLLTTPAYYRAGDIVPVLLLQALAVSSKYHFEFGILHSKQTKHYVYINAICGAAHLVLGFVLVRLFGIWGAALAGLSTSCLYGLLLHRTARRFFLIPFDFPRNAKAVAAAAAAVILARLVPDDTLMLAVMLKGIVTIVFGLCVIRLHGISVADVLRLADRRPAPAPIL
jgi:O-antigen/teichoic acid export membrane protein